MTKIYDRLKTLEARYTRWPYRLPVELQAIMEVRKELEQLSNRTNYLQEKLNMLYRALAHTQYDYLDRVDSDDEVNTERHINE